MSRPIQRSEPTSTELMPELVLPCQFAHGSARRSAPEVKLAAAILDNAIRSMLWPLGGDRGAREAAEASEWLYDGDRSWPFSFENICDVLSLDAGRLRRQLAGAIVSRIE